LFSHSLLDANVFAKIGWEIEDFFCPPVTN
jgi:hypothetical protein